MMNQNCVNYLQITDRNCRQQGGCILNHTECSGCPDYGFDPVGAVVTQAAFDELNEIASTAMALANSETLASVTSQLTLVSCLMKAISTGNRNWWGNTPAPERPLSIEGRAYDTYKKWCKATFV